MEGTYAEPDSSIPRAQGHAYHLCGSPRPRDLVPPPGLAAGGEKIQEWSSLAPSTGPEGIESSSLSGAPPENPNARGPGIVVSASAEEDSQLEPGPSDGPFPRNASRRSSPAQRDYVHNSENGSGYGQGRQYKISVRAQLLEIRLGSYEKGCWCDLGRGNSRCKWL